MNTFDVRTDSPTPEYGEIRFANNNSRCFTANVLRSCSNYGGVKIADSQESDRHVRILTKADADNLRKALDKAEQLGWLK